MRRAVGPVATAAVVAAVAAATGCSQTVSGTAQHAPAATPDPDRSYGYVDDRCGLLVDDAVRETVGADNVQRPYSGAVCQYVLFHGADPIDVTFSWFEGGSLQREHALAAQRGATLTDVVLERHQAFTARRDITGAACSATTAAGSGVLSWWVQFREKSASDPCFDAEKLLSATLQADM